MESWTIGIVPRHVFETRPIHDPAFERPDKPIGPLYAEDEAKALADSHGWSVAPDGDGHFDLMVPRSGTAAFRYAREGTYSAIAKLQGEAALLATAPLSEITVTLGELDLNGLGFSFSPSLSGIFPPEGPPLGRALPWCPWRRPRAARLRAGVSCLRIGRNRGLCTGRTRRA